MASKQTLVQRIALEGGDDIKRELLALGKAGEQAFKALERQAKASTAATKGINADFIALRASAVKLGAAIKKVGSNFSFLGGAVGQLAGAFATVFSAQTFIQLTSTWTDLQSRIANATGSAEVATETMARLSEVARRTYNPLQSLGETFADNAVILNELGISTAKQLNLQEALANALVVSGAKGERAAQVQRAFTNAMNLGALRGDDLNNVLKAGGALVPLLAKELGVAVTDLKKLGEQGKITSKVFQDALLKNFDELRAKAEAMPATIQDAFVLIQNSLLTYIGTASEANGISGAIADALILVADNMNIVIPAALGLAAAFLVIKGVQLARDLAGLARVILVDVIPSIFKLTLAIARNPLGLLAVVVAAVIVAIIEATGGFDNFGKMVVKVGAEVYAAIKPLVEPIMAILNAVGQAAQAFAQWLGLVPDDAAAATDSTQGLDGAVQNTTGSLGEAGSAGTSAGASISTGMDRAGDAAGGAAAGVDNLTSSLAAATEQARALAAEMAKVGGGGGGEDPKSKPLFGFAGGGRVTGPGTGTSDSILARLSNGEFVMRARAVRKWGVGMLSRLNAGLPAFASGGLVSISAPAPAFAGGAPGGVSGRPLTLVLDGEKFSGLIAPEAVAGKLAAFASGRKLKSAGGKPEWYK